MKASLTTLKSDEAGDGGAEVEVSTAIIVTFVLWALTFVSSILPLWWKGFEERKRELVFGLATSFACGVFFSAGIIHMLPEASELAEEEGSGLPSDYPLPFALCATAYLFLFFLQNYLEYWMMSKPKPGGRRTKKKSLPSRIGRKDYAVVEQDENHIEMDDITRGEGADVHAAHSHDHSAAIGHAMQKGGFSAVTVLAALSVHSVLEGVALGAQGDVANLMVVFIAIVCHKGIDGLTLGTKLCQANFSARFTLVGGFLFSLCTPAGAALGFILNSGVSSAVESVTLSLASGTFLFMGLNELKDELNPGKAHFFLNTVLTLLGFLLMALLKIWV